MTHAETSYMMIVMKNLMTIYLQSYGYGFPMVVAFNKGKALDIDIKNPNIVDKRISVFRGGKLISTEPCLPDDIFMQVLILRLQDEKDEKVLEEVFKIVGKKYNPDACAFMQSCFYGEYDDPLSISNDTMTADPNVFNVLNISYFTKEDPIPRICVMPFINKGEVKENSSLFEEREDTSKYNVLMIGCGWFLPYPNIKSIVQNPY